jgi:hypothetical protein
LCGYAGSKQEIGHRIAGAQEGSLQQGKIGLFEMGMKIPNYTGRAALSDVQILQMKGEILHPPHRPLS